MPILSFSKRSIRAFGEKLQQTLVSMVDGGASALKEHAEEVMAMSQEQVPVDTGALRDSAFIDEPVRKRGDVSIRMGYGGDASNMNPKTYRLVSDYVVPVHERLDVVHPVGKAKFLEDPLMEKAQELGVTMSEFMEGEISGVLRRRK
jgi:hypothetical protein